MKTHFYRTRVAALVTVFAVIALIVYYFRHGDQLLALLYGVFSFAVAPMFPRAWQRNVTVAGFLILFAVLYSADPESSRLPIHVVLLMVANVMISPFVFWRRMYTVADFHTIWAPILIGIIAAFARSAGAQWWFVAALVIGGLLYAAIRAKMLDKSNTETPVQATDTVPAATPPKA